jgi:hypothetical protein
MLGTEGSSGSNDSKGSTNVDFGFAAGEADGAAAVGIDVPLETRAAESFNESNRDPLELDTADAPFNESSNEPDEESPFKESRREPPGAAVEAVTAGVSFNVSRKDVVVAG